MSISFTKGKSE